MPLVSNFEARRRARDAFDDAVNRQAVELHQPVVDVEGHHRVDFEVAADVGRAACRNGRSLSPAPACRRPKRGQAAWLHLAQHVGVARLAVAVGDGRIADIDAGHLDGAEPSAAAASAGAAVSSASRSSQLLAAAADRPRRLSFSVVELRGIDGHFPAQQHRQQSNAELRPVELGEGLVAEARRIAERRVADLDRQPREKRQRDVAFDRQLATRSCL